MFKPKLGSRVRELSDQRGLTRRRFMEQAAALGLTVSAASSLWSSRVQAAPKKGGHAIIGCHGAQTTDSFDPASVPDMYISVTRTAVFSTLVEVRPDGVLSPLLAESYESTAGAQQWRFNLRKDVTFHNGKTVTPDDVIATMKLHLDPGTKSPMSTVLASVEKISKDGDTVVFELSSGNADFPVLMSEYMLSILPSEDGVATWKDGHGTGAYKLEQLEPGIRAKLVRNTDYYMPDRGNFDSIEMLAINDEVARTNALISGEVHAATQVPPVIISRLKNVPSVELDIRTTGDFYTYDMLMTNAPFSDNNVRMALKHAIDREQFVARALSGFGVVGNDHPLGPFYEYHPADLPQRAYDPEKAKHYLKKAGLSSLKVPIHSGPNTFPNALDGAVLISEFAKQAGIEIEVVQEPDDGYGANVWGKKPWFASHWTSRAAADAILTAAFLGGQPWNVTGFDNHRVNKLAVEARTVLDRKKRAEMYAEIALTMRDEGASAIVAHPQAVDAVSDKIERDGGTTALTNLASRKALEFWSFKA